MRSASFLIWCLLGYARFDEGFPLGLESFFPAKDKRRIWKVGRLCTFGWFGRPEIVLYIEMRFCLYKI